MAKGVPDMKRNIIHRQMCVCVSACVYLSVCVLFSRYGDKKKKGKKL